MIETAEILQWRGRNVVDAQGGHVGTLEEIYLDQDTDRPEWALIDGQRFVPLTDVTAEGEDVRLPFSSSQIKGAPQVGADGELSQDDEAVLYDHYGVNYSEGRSDSGLPEGQASDPTPRGTEGVVGNDVSGAETDNAMTRSEEELRIGTTKRERGRVRLRKYIVSENVSQDVSLASEQVKVTREPITDANVGQATSGADLSEEEHEVTLMKEEAVIQKTVVPKERIRLDKDTVAENVQVSEEVRREEVELVDGQDAPERGIDGEHGTDEGIDRR